MRSIEDNVTKDELLDAVPAIYENWKQRDPKASAPRERVI
jgi:hypothetical protein